MTRSIWRENFVEEMQRMDDLSIRYPFVAVDTEFPGFLWITPRDASEQQRYADLKSNIDAMKPIQVGITLFDDAGNMGCTWEFNLHFDVNKDKHSPMSVNFLQKNGMDLERHRRYGIDQATFGTFLYSLFRKKFMQLHFVFFHGLYDMGYLLKMVGGGLPLPNDAGGFWASVKNLFYNFYDVKHMIQYYPVLSGANVGLEAAGRALGLQREGSAHHAGSDSRLTAALFAKIKPLLLGMRYVPRLPEGIFHGLESAQNTVML